MDDVDTLLTLLGVAGVTLMTGIPGADDIMLNYQSTSYHDALYINHILRKISAQLGCREGLLLRKNIGLHLALPLV